MTAEEFREQYQQSIPNEPGVYRYFNDNNEILYIGKAKNLRKRVSSYFNNGDLSYRILVMVRSIAKIEFTIVSTEQDAFLLENSLIKQYQPRYNINLKDDKTYPYIVIKNEPFPRVFLTRNVIKDGSQYIGPFTSVNSVREVLNLLSMLFPIRTCTLSLTRKNIQAGKFKVCLEYHMKRCLAPCVGYITEEEYNENITEIKNLLKSDFGSVMRFLKRKMNEFAEQLDFETANTFKEKIEALDAWQSKSTIVNPRLHNIDVYGYSEAKNFAFVSFLKIGNGTIVRAKTLEVKKQLDEAPEEILQRAIVEISFGEESEMQAENPEIILPFEVEIPFAHTLVIPQAGDKKKLLDLATRNALYAKEDKVKSLMTSEEKNPSFRIMRTLKEDLKLKELPRHIECFDNSNIMGTNAVSACVVFKDAKPSKKDYRIFNVKTVVGPNDFATMEEVIYRRYKRMVEEEQTLPQLIIVDGGKGQLSSAIISLEKLSLYGKIPIVGIAKNLEEIYFPEDSIPLHINKKSESLKLIQRMRDEAHRFGITHHRDKRSKNFTVTELEGIKGIGKKTTDLLLSHFGSMAQLKQATLQEIATLVGSTKAAIVQKHFSGTQEIDNKK
ncbi:MAG TPA: excinuclease ABC subunit UvrC [Chitinophagales bacterium]|nr:excinuclease ABC subunit UvrC [Chitinophagales bacterium]